MDDTNDSSGVPEPELTERSAMVAMYLESLQARMEPEKFDALMRGLMGLRDAFVHGGPDGGTFEADDGFTEDVRRELMLVLAMVETGRMDYDVVEFEGSEGRALAVVDSDLAGDPERLADVGERLSEWVREQRAVDGVLEGIEEASRNDPRAEPGSGV